MWYNTGVVKLELRIVNGELGVKGDVLLLPVLRRVAPNVIAFGVLRLPAGRARPSHVEDLNPSTPLGTSIE